MYGENIRSIMQRTELERIARLEDRASDLALENHQLKLENKQLKERIMVLESKPFLEVKYPLEEN